LANVWKFKFAIIVSFALLTGGCLDFDFDMGRFAVAFENPPGNCKKIDKRLLGKWHYADANQGNAIQIRPTGKGLIEIISPDGNDIDANEILKAKCCKIGKDRFLFVQSGVNQNCGIANKMAYWGLHYTFKGNDQILLRAFDHNKIEKMVAQGILQKRQADPNCGTMISSSSEEAAKAIKKYGAAAFVCEPNEAWVFCKEMP